MSGVHCHTSAMMTETMAVASVVSQGIATACPLTIERIPLIGPLV